jgi:phytoene/squalene synthetase
MPICSALQLINHWQDVGIDAAKGDQRPNLPAAGRHGALRRQ